MAGAWVVAEVRLVSLVLLTACGVACATLHESSPHSAHAVAACIAQKWEHCGSGAKLPVRLQEEAGATFVGIAVAGVSTLPSGAEHSSYQVWVEVKDTGNGCETTYHRAYQLAHKCLDDAVEVCQTMEVP
jgi:hypothetical protein